MHSNYLSPTDIAQCIGNLIGRNKLWAKKSVKLYFIVNSQAGCFTNKKLSRRYCELFKSKNEEILKTDICSKSVDYEIFETEHKGHASELTIFALRKIIETDKSANNTSADYIIVTAGGDGTCLEVQTALFEAIQNYKNKYNELTKRVAILRLPLGTGNDGTDGSSIEETFNLLQSGIVYSSSKVLVAHTKNNPDPEIVKESNKHVAKYCDVNSKSPWYAFNIASIGLDAFVAFTTNLIKTKLPGNLYHLCVPLSGLFFTRVFKIGFGKINIYQNSHDKMPSDVYNGTIYLSALGASGYRTYGGGQKVLPDFNNLCITPKVTLGRLIRENHKFVDGTHAHTDIGIMYSTDKIEINYSEPTMLQCDGECYLLCKDHFPLTIEKQDSGFNILKKMN